MSDEQLMDLLMADKYGSVERGYFLDDDSGRSYGYPYVPAGRRD